MRTICAEMKELLSDFSLRSHQVFAIRLSVAAVNEHKSNINNLMNEINKNNNNNSFCSRIFILFGRRSFVRCTVTSVPVNAEALISDFLSSTFPTEFGHFDGFAYVLDRFYNAFALRKRQFVQKT